MGWYCGGDVAAESLRCLSRGVPDCALAGYLAALVEESLPIT